MTVTTTLTQEKKATVKAAPAAKEGSGAGLLARFVPKAGVGAGKLVSAAELAENCGIGSTSGRAWVALHGHVFDITEFSKTHPGGKSIRLAAGRDGTCLVESYHPATSIARVEAALLSKAEYIGALAPLNEAGQAATTPAQALAAYTRPDDAFFVDVRARVDKLIASKGVSRYAYDALGVAEAVLTMLVYFYAIYQVGVYGSWPWTLALGILTGRMGFLMHMGNHCAISHSPTINRLVGWFMDLAGSNCTIWGYEHQVAHHGEPNEFHRDNDCEIGNPFIRMHPEIPHAEPQRFQHIVVPVAMTIGFFKWYVGDFGHFFAKQVGNVRMAIDRHDWYLLLSFKAVWMFLHVLLPVYYQGWGLAMAQLFVFMGLGGHYLENIFIVNHIQNGLVPPPQAHWASKQVMATANWKSGSAFWNWFSGGLNHQIEHHMFPTLSYFWYSQISDVVRATAADHGLPYENFATFPQAWWAMFTYLRDLGRPDFVSKTGQKGAPPLIHSAKVHAA